jgi:hypothetical protein
MVSDKHEHAQQRLILFQRSSAGELFRPFLPHSLAVKWRSHHRLRLFCFKGTQVGIRSRKRPICDVEIGPSTADLCNLVNLLHYHS